MKRIALGIAMSAAFAGSAFAEGGPGCGLGSMLFNGQSGVVPQVAAATTNGTSGNQTFGMSTGTLGCSPNDKVTNSAKLGMFLNSNMEKVARDMSVGNGESLATVADLIGVEAADRSVFYTAARDNFSKVFNSADVTAENVVSNLKSVLAADVKLSRYADKV